MEESLLSPRNLGSISAEDDENFKQHFVETSEFHQLLSEKCLIVAGAKGSGKTALMRALSDIPAYSDRYIAVHPVKLDGIKFGPLFTAIKRLDDASEHGVVSIARTMWMNVFAIFALEASVKYKLVSGRERGEISKYLLDNGYSGANASDKLLGHLERIWQLITKLSQDNKPEKESSLLSLQMRQQHAISAFPSDSKLDRLLSLVLERIKESGKRLLVCFDGLDSIVEYSLESRDYIFAGLIDAAYKSATHPGLKGALVVRVLIPKELAHGSRNLLRDLDKIDQYMASVHWDGENLAAFIKRRLEEYIKSKGKPFNDVWHEFFPDRVRNDIHNLEEESFSYLLRHTLYRPRQLLIHIQEILDAWDKRPTTSSFRVDPTFIPKIVSETNNGLAEYVVNELCLDFPSLRDFLKSMRGLSCAISWQELADRIQRYLLIPAEKASDAFTELYNYGIFGLVNDLPGQEGKKTSTQFYFGFMTRGVERNIGRDLTDQSMVVLSPMFVEYCGCKPSTIGVVSPSPYY